MAVAIAQHGSVTTMIGSDAEVAQAISDEQIPGGKLISVYFNGTNTTAMYYTV